MRKLNRIRTFCSNANPIPINELETPTLFISYQEETEVDIVDIDWKGQQRLEIKVWSEDQVLATYKYWPGLDISNIGLDDLKRAKGENNTESFYRKDDVQNLISWVVFGSMWSGVVMGIVAMKFVNK